MNLRKCSLPWLLLWAVTTTISAAPPEEVPGAIVGYSAGGVMSLVGEGLVECVRREYPGSSLTYEPGNPAGGIASVASSKRPFALISPIEAVVALAGEEPFLRKYTKKEIYGIARVVNGLHFVIYARRAFMDHYGISTFKDIAEKKPPIRISTNTKGNLIAQRVAQAIMHAHDISYDNVKKWGGEIFYLPIQQTHDLMRNGRLDMYMTATFPPGSQLLELASSTPIGFVRLEDSVVEGLAVSLGLEISDIPADTYPSQREPLRTLAAPILLISGAQYGNSVYNATRAIYNQFDYYKALHPQFSILSQAMLPRVQPLSLHPEAARFYHEVALIPN